MSTDMQQIPTSLDLTKIVNPDNINTTDVEVIKCQNLLIKEFMDAVHQAPSAVKSKYVVFKSPDCVADHDDPNMIFTSTFKRAFKDKGYDITYFSSSHDFFDGYKNYYYCAIAHKPWIFQRIGLRIITHLFW
jgi:hypothetical protein